MRREILKRVLFPVVLAALVAGFVELSSCLFFSCFRKRFTFFDLKSCTVKPSQIPSLRQQSSARLGWDMQYKTPYGERPRVISYDRPLIATFGESFTHCDEVRHHETWQTYLSALLKRDVFNFGTRAYGTDQAYLKFTSVYPRVKTPIVTLGIMTENINRCVNVYRPFYYAQTGFWMTKPRFALERGRLALLENPIRRKKDLEQLENPRFVQSLGKNDWWYNRDSHPVLEFPYSRILLNKRMWLEAYYGKGSRTISDVNPRPWPYLLDVPEATQLLLKIAESFIKDAKGYGVTPVVMILPLEAEVTSKFRTGKDQKAISLIKELCRREQCLCFDGVAALARNIRSVQDAKPLFTWHTTAQGNRVLAREFFEFLKKQGLLDGAPAAR